MPGPQAPRLLSVLLLAEVTDAERVGSMVMVAVMVVVKMDEEAVVSIVLLKIADEYGALVSRVMLGNSVERGIATFMPTIRVIHINYIFNISINILDGNRH